MFRPDPVQSKSSSGLGAANEGTGGRKRPTPGKSPRASAARRAARRRYGLTQTQQEDDSSDNGCGSVDEAGAAAEVAATEAQGSLASPEKSFGSVIAEEEIDDHQSVHHSQEEGNDESMLLDDVEISLAQSYSEVVNLSIHLEPTQIASEGGGCVRDGSASDGVVVVPESDPGTAVMVPETDPDAIPDELPSSVPQAEGSASKVTGAERSDAVK
eukprot:CAMPEP_0113533222 /NCGR_PEP_ID=MMETSP0015_2-20120614/4480_1 /TAXON_ID=2838 /ORGANISM="Odontella" /LENGTH=213 /DNA_ID=CAMNT_0000432241 /DNA_START=175 /DNA_END=813 /DNA_ORIENTATION=- /assembly_acc=CAM_ASM_000160